MGSPIQFLRSFPTQQQRELAAAMRLVRRRVDQSLTAVALVTNATTTMATLTCPANELEVGSSMHVQIAGTLTNGAAGADTWTPLLALNGTTIWTDVGAVDGAVATARSYLIDARIIWQTPAVVLLTGFIVLSPDTVKADTGNGSLVTVVGDATDVVMTPIYHTLSSQVMARDQTITATMALSNGPTGTVNAATLWVE